MRIKIEKRINKNENIAKRQSSLLVLVDLKIEIIIFAIIILFLHPLLSSIHLNTLPGVGRSVNTPCLLSIQRKEASSLMINSDSTTIKRTAMTMIIVSFFL